VDWGSRLRGYHPVASRPFKARALCAPPLVPLIISRGAHVKRHERPVLVKDGIGREMASQFGLLLRLLRKSQVSFTCRKSATWDRRLYFPSEGRHAVDFFARNIRRLRPSSNPRSWVPEARMLTTRLLTPLFWGTTWNLNPRIKEGLTRLFRLHTLHCVECEDYYKW
jgi:hypothetical protein